MAVADATPVQIPSKYYYGIPVRPIFKSYPVYRPDREPAGYLEWLKQQEPQIVFDAAKLKTREDWIRAGEIVFDAPISFGHIFRLAASDLYLRLPDWYRSTGAPLLRDGSLPFYRYVIREKGKVEIGVNSCGMCHTRVMPDNSVRYFFTTTIWARKSTNEPMSSASPAKITRSNCGAAASSQSNCGNE